MKQKILQNNTEHRLDLVGLPYKDKKLFSQYSLGMKQQLAVALAVMHDPKFLILDEPINGLDPIGIAEVRSFIRDLCSERGKTILFTLKNILTVPVSRFCIILSKIIVGYGLVIIEWIFSFINTFEFRMHKGEFDLLLL